MSDLPELPPEVAAEVARLAERERRANGPVMRAVNAFGGQIEGWVAKLPASARRVIDDSAEKMLLNLYSGAATAARLLPETSTRAHKFAAAMSGAAGGAAGIASAVVEMPATVMVMFAAMQRIAVEYGFDPNSQEVRLTCIDIFGSGGPGRADDGSNTAFLGARLSLNGTTVHALVARVAPAFSAMMTKSIASKSVPILGAAAGAGVNYAFAHYYCELAHARFGLQRLTQEYGEEAVVAAYKDVARLEKAGH